MRTAALPLLLTLLLAAPHALAHEPPPPPDPAATPAAPQDGDAPQDDEAAAAEVYLTPDFRVGERCVIDMTFERTDAKGDAPPRVMTSEAVATAEVLEENEDHWVIGWSVRLEAAPAGAPDLLLEIVAATPRMEIIIDFAGNLLGVRNWEEMREHALRSADEMGDRFFAGADPEVRARVDGMLAAMVRDRAATEATLLKHAAWYFYPVGCLLTPGEPTVYEEQMPGAIEGVIDATVTVSLERTDPETEEATMRYERTADPEGTRRAMLGTLDRIAPDAAAQPEVKEAEVSLRDVLVATYDPSIAWVTDAQFARTVRVGEGTRVEAVRWRLREFIPSPEDAAEPAEPEEPAEAAEPAAE